MFKIFLAVVGFVLMLSGIVAVFRESAGWRRRTIVLTGLGGLIMLAVGIYNYQGPPNDGWAAWIVAGIFSWLWTAISWLSGSKLGFWIDNRRWPTEQERQAMREDC